SRARPRLRASWKSNGASSRCSVNARSGDSTRSARRRGTPHRISSSPTSTPPPFQMENQGLFELAEDGVLHSECLFWEGFPYTLWEVLSSAGYVLSPHYACLEYTEQDVPRCRVQVSVAPHPDRPWWPGLDTEVVGYRLQDTIERAALRVLGVFCDHHPTEVMLAPIGLLPAPQPYDPLWLDRVSYLDATVAFHGGVETAQDLACLVRILYRVQSVQHRALAEVTERAMTFHADLGQLRADHTDLSTQLIAMDVDRTDLQGLVAELQDQVTHLQGQVEELQTEQIEYLDRITELEDDVHDYQAQLHDAQGLIEVLQEQGPEAQDVEMEDEEEEEPMEVEVEPEELQGISGTDTVSAVAPPPAAPGSPAESAASVNDLDDF
ncbi:unnamed protein product, partial [Urochloa humidicola]